MYSPPFGAGFYKGKIMPNTKPVGVAFSDPEFTSGTTITGGTLNSTTITGGTLDSTPIGASTPSTVVGTTVYATNELGYNATASGTVTQATSKTTGVTLNKSIGRITMNGALLAGGASALFTLTNSQISANDVVIATVSGGGTAGAYWPFVSSLAAGSAVIGLYNNTAGNLSEAVIINFAVIHGA